MMTNNVSPVPVCALAQAWAALARQQMSTSRNAGSRRLNVFLECESDRRFENWIRAELDFVTFVDARRDADVCVNATQVPGRGEARYYRVVFVGAGPFEGIEASARLHLPASVSTSFRRPAAADVEFTPRELRAFPAMLAQLATLG